MSQFGNGPKPPAWGRPPAPMAAPFGTGQFPGVTSGQAFGMTNPMGMMGMPLVNQAAFQQNTMNMGTMGMMAQQAQLNAANAANAAKMSQFQQGAAVTAAAAQQTQQKNQRTFVGLVTKMHDNYGFVDDDVFFQHSVIRGSLPRVGDRVMVEASFNPNMPFKWNAHRVQILGDSSGGGAPSAPSGPSPTSMMRAPVQQSMPAPAQPSGGSRWGPQAASNNRAASPRRRSPPRRSSPRRNSPARRSPPPRRRSPSPRRSPARRSPVRRAASPHQSRKRERSPAHSSTPHERTPAVDKKDKKDSASPPRRRARIIPRYVVNTPKQIFTGTAIQSSMLKKRFSHLYIPSDFVDAAIDWASQIPVDAPLDFSTSVQYHIFHKDVEIPESEVEHVDVTDADSRFIVKVALLAHPDKTELQKKTWGLLPDGSTDDTVEPTSVNKNIHLLVGSRGKEVMGIGGAWSPSLDGPNPNALPTMIKTAIRTTRTLTGIDLSNVTAWYQLVQVRYFRSDRGRVDRVTLLLPDTAGIVPDEESLKLMESVLKEQLVTKQNGIDEEAVKAALEEEAAKKEAEAAANAAAAAVKEEPKEENDVKDESMVSESGDVEMESPVKGGTKTDGTPTHYAELDVKAMKVAELKVELEARGLETKGIKTLLAQRLQEALDKEKEKDEKKEEEVEEKKSEEKVEKEEKKVEEKKDEKTDEQKKKEEEEKKKAAEKAEKERKERKASLEKHFVFPKEPKVLVFPSKTAKGGKFDCKVVSLAGMLDYREADNKESQFEMSLFAEALRDVLERTFAFRVYSAIVIAADKEVEKKKREEAKEKKEEKEGEEKKEGEEVKEEEKKKEEKEKEDKKKVEKIELRPVVVKRDIFEAFAYFDQNLCGYVHERDLDEILSTSDLGIPRGQIAKLAKKLSGSGSKINYRYLTDSLVDPDGETRHIPGEIENAPSVEELARGYGHSYKAADDAVIEMGESVLNQDLVSIDGVVINVRQKILAVKRLEGERDASAAKMKELETSLKNVRDAKEVVEKKKKRLDEDVDKYQKRLRDTEKTLKLAQDEVSLMKSGVSDMKELARKIMGVADKTLPKKEKKKEEKKEEKKENGVSEKTEKTEEDEEPMAIEGAELMLADQVGGDDDNDMEEEEEESAAAAEEDVTTAVETTA